MRALALLLLVAGCVGSGNTFSTESGLSYTVITKGPDPAARASQHVSIHGSATFADGHSPSTARAAANRSSPGSTKDRGHAGRRAAQDAHTADPEQARRSDDDRCIELGSVSLVLTSRSGLQALSV